MGFIRWSEGGEYILSDKSNENKRRTAVWLYPSTMRQMDYYLEKDNAKSRSEFIERALQFYIGHIATDQAQDYLAEALAAMISGLLNAPARRLGSQLFRLAVEMSMMMHILAAGLDISDDELSRLRVRCLKEVKAMRLPEMARAIQFQRGELDESDVD